MEKSIGSRYCDCVLAMYSTVAFVPGVMSVTPFEVMGLPLPNKPIWLNGAELQVGGWQTAVIVAAPGKVGEIDPPAAAIVVGLVETKVRFAPMIGTLLVSITVAVSGSVVLMATPAGPLPPVDNARVMLAGGHVEKKPAAPPVPEFATFAVTIVEPGCCAVTTPFWSTVKMLPFWPEKLTCPTRHVMLSAGNVDPFW